MSIELKNSIKQLRKERGMTIQELADKVGCSKSQISLLESGKRGFSESWQIRLSKAFDLMPEELIDVDQIDKKALRTKISKSFFNGIANSKEDEVIISKFLIWKFADRNLVSIIMPDESMALDIKINSYLVIDTDQNIINEKTEGIYLFAFREKYYIRKIEIKANGLFSFIAYNDQYCNNEKRIFQDINEQEVSKSFRFIGKIITVITSMYY